MKTITLILTFFILNNNNLFGQEQGPPPPVAMPDKENEVLIDELIDVCNYKLLFNQLKDSIINDFSIKNQWSKSKIKEVRSKTSYEIFSKDMYYNAFAMKTREQLLLLLTYYKSIPKKELKKEFKNYDSFIIHNYKNRIMHSCMEE